MNFYKIEKESYINELMINNPDKLFVLIFSLDSNFDKNVLNNTFIIKKNIKKNLSNENNTIFLYVNLQRYIIKENKYSHSIKQNSLPYVSFYYKNNELARITETEYSVLNDTYYKLLENLEEHFKLSNKNSEMSNDTKNDNNNEEVNEKHDENMDELTDKIRQQRKLEEIEKLKQQYLINELTKLQRAKEIQEKQENNN